MFTKNGLSVSTNRSVKWDYMIDRLGGLIEEQDIKPYVEILLLQHPVNGNKIGASTFHYANSPK
jgi:hypothetical protein